MTSSVSVPASVFDRSSLPGVCGVVVTFFPKPETARRIDAIRAECDYVVVVDNHSPPDSMKVVYDLPEIEVVSLSKNIGLAAALNIGLKRAIELGFAWAVTFDQDSSPQPGMIAALWKTRCNADAPERIALIGPRLREEYIVHEERRWLKPSPGSRLLFKRVPCLDSDLAGVTFIITSGALMDLGCFMKIGPMEEGLFIDYIDHDYCLRARRLGYDILVSADAMLVHNLGEKREFSVAGQIVRPTFHSPLRLRYIFRNRWFVLRRHARMFPHWAAFDFIFVHYNLLRIVIFEDRKWEKIRATVRGTIDGLRGKQGPIID